MKFEEAVKLLKEGKKVRRRKWTQGDGIIVSSLGYLSWSKKEIHPNLSFESYVADDWEEFKEEDDWNIKDAPYDTRNPMKGIEKLKTKILEDIKNITGRCPNCDVEKREDKCIPPEELEAIVERRFGF